MFGKIKLKRIEQSQISLVKKTEGRIDIRQGSELLAVIRLYPDKLEIHTWKKPQKVVETIESIEHGSKSRRFKLDKNCGSVELEIKLPNGDC